MPTPPASPASPAHASLAAAFAAIAAATAVAAVALAGCGAPGKPAKGAASPAAASPAYAAVGNRPDNAADDVAPADIGKRALALGAVAPAVEVRDQDGHPWTVAAAAKGHKHLVLVFYRGDWCPYCRAQLAELEAHAADFAQKDAAVAAISVDSAETAAHLAQGLGLHFPLVSDPGHHLIGAFGVFDASTEIAWPAVYIVDEGGAIDWRWIADDFKKRITTVEVLGALGGEAVTMR